MGDAVDPALQALTPYQMLGGAAVLRQLVDRFYDLMASDPRTASLHAMHSTDTTLIRQKLFEFFCRAGWVAHRYISKKIRPSDVARPPSALCGG